MDLEAYSSIAFEPSCLFWLCVTLLTPTLVMEAPACDSILSKLLAQVLPVAVVLLLFGSFLPAEAVLLLDFFQPT